MFGPIPPVAAVEVPFATAYRDFYINFVNDLNPGREWHDLWLGAADVPAKIKLSSAEWPAYTPSSPRVMQLLRDNITLIDDGL